MINICELENQQTLNNPSHDQLETINHWFLNSFFFKMTKFRNILQHTYNVLLELHAMKHFRKQI